MVITTGGKKRCLASVALCEFEAEHIAIELKRTFQISPLQMNVTDQNPCIQLSSHRILYLRVQ